MLQVIPLGIFSDLLQFFTNEVLAVLLSLNMPATVFRFDRLMKSGGQSVLTDVIPSGLLPMC